MPSQQLRISYCLFQRSTLISTSSSPPLSCVKPNNSIKRMSICVSARTMPCSWASQDNQPVDAINVLTRISYPPPFIELDCAMFSFILISSLIHRVIVMRIFFRSIFLHMLSSLPSPLPPPLPFDPLFHVHHLIINPLDFMSLILLTSKIEYMSTWSGYCWLC